MKSYLIEEQYIRSSIRRMFENSPKEAVGELLQNSQRAGATTVNTVVDMVNHRFIYEDNGHGISQSNDSWYKLLALGASEFRDTVAEQDPMGLGINALLSMQDVTRVSIESNGRMINIDVLRWWSDESYYSKWQQLIKSIPGTSSGFLIDVKFKEDNEAYKTLEKFNSALADNSSSVVAGYHNLKVVHNSREIEYRFRPSNIVRVTEFKGNPLTLYVCDTMRSVGVVNWYGQLINSVTTLGPDGLSFYYDVNSGTPLTPKSPARSGIIDDQLFREFADFVEEEMYQTLYRELKPLCDEVVAKGWSHARNITRSENPEEQPLLPQHIDLREPEWFNRYYRWMLAKVKPGRSPLPLIQLDYGISSDWISSDWTSHDSSSNGAYFYHNDGQLKPNLFIVRECPIMLGWSERRALPQSLQAEEARQLIGESLVSQRLTSCGITYANEYEFGVQSFRAEADLLDEESGIKTVWVPYSGDAKSGIIHVVVWIPGELIDEGSSLEAYKGGHWALLRYPKDDEQEVTVQWHPVQEHVAVFNKTSGSITNVEDLAIGTKSLFEFLNECGLFAFYDPDEVEESAESYWRESLIEEQRALMGNALPQDFSYRSLHSRIKEEHYHGKRYDPEQEELVINQLKYVRSNGQFMPTGIEVSYSVQSAKSTEHFQTSVRLYGEYQL